MPSGTAERPLLAGRYRIVKRLGAGGMAAVYLAEDERLGRLVAVKRLHLGGEDESDARRFQREARIGASLSHRNLVSIFDTEQDDESVLLVMEYVEGETLADLMARGPLEPDRAARILREVAEALDHAHDAGVVHRDVKPANVLLGKDGAVKLADLGIARAVERTDITHTGTVLGTPAYMAPEQLEGGRPGPAVDVYALAVMAFEMLTGRRARAGRTPVEIAHQVVNEPVPDPRAHEPGMPADTAAAIRAGMARDPRDRPASAGELARRLRPRPPGTKIHSSRPAPGRLIVAGGLLAATLAAVVVGLTAGGDGGSQEPAGKADKGNKEEKASPAEATEPAAQEAVAAPSEPAVEPKEKGSIDEAHQLQAEGYSALQAGDYKNAVKLSEKAVKAFPEGTSDPQYAYALFNLGRALRLSGKPDKAIPVLEQRLQIPNQTATVQRELEAARREADK